MKKDIAIKLQNISKVYKLYDKPIDRLKEALHPLKKQYHKDFYALKDINLEIKKGEVLTEDNLTIKRPGTGLSPMNWDEIIGKTATRDYSKDEIIIANGKE